MKRLHWFAVGGAVVFVAIAIGLWLYPPIKSGITGDITVLRLLNYANKWQTLLATAVALIAATLAYRGAIAKVSFDRAVHQRNEIQRSVGLAMRLDLAANLLRTRAKFLLEMTDPDDAGRAAVMEISDVTIPDRAAIMQAWENIERISVRSSYHVYEIGRHLSYFDLWISNMRSDSFLKDVPAETISGIRTALKCIYNESIELRKETTAFVLLYKSSPDVFQAAAIETSAD